MRAEEYIKQISLLLNAGRMGKQAAYYAWLAEAGTSFTGDRIATVKEYRPKAKHIRHLAVRRCYDNSIKYLSNAIKDGVPVEDVKYYEGYYVLEDMPELCLEHGFNVVNVAGEQKAICLTSRKNYFRVLELFGVEIPLPAIVELLKEGRDVNLLYLYWKHYIAAAAQVKS